MTRAMLSTVSAFIVVFISSCTPSRTQRDLKESVSSIHHYVNTFKGLSEDQVRTKLAAAKLTEEEWKQDGFEGRQLVATFPDYEIRVLFFKDKAVTTSFQVLSK